MDLFRKALYRGVHQELLEMDQGDRVNIFWRVTVAPLVVGAYASRDDFIGARKEVLIRPALRLIMNHQENR